MPPGVTVGEVSDDGQFSETTGAIRWFFMDVEPRVLVYRLTVADGSPGNAAELSGLVSVDGLNTAIPGESRLITTKGDFDRDGDVDLADFLEMIQCFGGPSEATASDCDVFDFDDDEDIDLSDVVAFQAAYSSR